MQKKNRLLVLAALVMGVVFLFGQPATTAGAKAKTAKAVKAAKAAKAGKAGRIGQAIGLTADQKSRIKAIHADAKTQAAAVKADQTLTADAKKVQIKAIRRAAVAQIRQLLTPEQQAKLRKGAVAHRASRAGRISQALGLTADQKTRIKAIRGDAAAQMKALKDDTSLTPDAKRAKVKEIRAAAKTQMMQVLSAEQRAKIEAARSRRGKVKQL